MLTFFRRIRKSLLRSGQVTKPAGGAGRAASSSGRYLLYAIGEIALVVIGILIALQINNWNEDKNTEREVRSHLESLADAIDHDILELSISMEFNEFRYNSWRYILQWAAVPISSTSEIPRPDTFIVHVWDKSIPDTLNKEYIDLGMEQLNWAGLNMVFVYSAINEMNSLGIMSEIKDESLKEKINDYYYYLNWRFGESSVNRRYQAAKDLREYLRDNHGISSNYPPDPQFLFKIIRNDPRIGIMLEDLIKIANNHYWDTNELRNKARELSKLLRSQTQE